MSIHARLQGPMGSKGWVTKAIVAEARIGSCRVNWRRDAGASLIIQCVSWQAGMNACNLLESKETAQYGHGILAVAC